MIAAEAQRPTAHDNQEPPGCRRQADVQPRDGHEMAGPGLRVSLPLLRGDAVPRADRNRGNDRRRVRIPEDGLQPSDDALPQLVDRMTRCLLEPPVAMPVDDIPRRAEALAEEPGFVVEHAGIARATWSPQPHLELPDVADFRTFGSVVPAQTHRRRNSRVVNGAGQETGRLTPLAGKIGDLQYRQYAVAFEPGRQPRTDDLHRVQGEQDEPGDKPGRGPAAAGRERDGGTEYRREK